MATKLPALREADSDLLLLTNPKFITVQLNNAFQSAALLIDLKIWSFLSYSSPHFCLFLQNLCEIKAAR